MDFEIAASRLKKDQQSALARSRASRNARTASAKAKREAQLSRAKAEKRLKQKKLENERSAGAADKVARCVGRAERGLGVANVRGGAPAAAVVRPVKSTTARSTSISAAAAATGDNQYTQLFSNSPLASGWTFSATSIHGEGDKIALPPSVLETMTSGNNDLDPWGSGRNGRPIAFRIGVLNPDYGGFPSSDTMRELVEETKKEVIASVKSEMVHQSSSVTDSSQTNGLSNNSNEDMEGSDDDETDDSSIIEAYLAELSHRYLSYTHGTVVEFTQDNDCVGLPEPIARALLQPNAHSLVGINSNTGLKGKKRDIPAKRTADPAAAAAVKDESDEDAAKESGEVNSAMDVDMPNNTADTGEQTPGHPAYGLFDVPSLPIEIIPINSLPPGRNCTFTPTASSIKNGFYGLKDVKVVLEQSLMRTRATLSKGDVIRTWRRGVSFDLIISSLTPADYGVVSCINTNINVDIGPPEGEEADFLEKSNQNKETKPEQSSMGGGRLLSEPSQAKPTQSTPTSPAVAITEIELPPEPAGNVKEGVCNIQIRGRTPSGSSAAGRRRFDIASANMGNLFAFASNICEGANPSSFRLVTRFPRRVFQLSSEEGCFNADATLESAGIAQGQEMFMVELV